MTASQALCCSGTVGLVGSRNFFRGNEVGGILRRATRVEHIAAVKDLVGAAVAELVGDDRAFGNPMGGVAGLDGKILLNPVVRVRS